MGKYRVTVDTGGTFSDFVCLDEDTGAISVTKLPSTPDDPSRSIVDGIETLLAGGTRAAHIAFDVTPHRYITAIVTENGVARPPYAGSLQELATARNAA